MYAEETLAGREETEKERRETTAAIQALKDLHIVLEENATKSIRRAIDAEAALAAEKMARHTAEGALSAACERALAARENTVSARVETLSAREETLAERATIVAKERTIDALTAAKGNAGREREEMVAALEAMQEKLSLWETKNGEEATRPDAAENKASELEKAGCVMKAALTASKDEATAARAATLTGKERAAHALTSGNGDTSASGSQAAGRAIRFYAGGHVTPGGGRAPRGGGYF